MRDLSITSIIVRDFIVHESHESSTYWNHPYESTIVEIQEIASSVLDVSMLQCTRVSVSRIAAGGGGHMLCLMESATLSDYYGCECESMIVSFLCCVHR